MVADIQTYDYRPITYKKHIVIILLYKERYLPIGLICLVENIHWY